MKLSILLSNRLLKKASHGNNFMGWDLSTSMMDGILVMHCAADARWAEWICWCLNDAGYDAAPKEIGSSEQPEGHLSSGNLSRDQSAVAVVFSSELISTLISDPSIADELMTFVSRRRPIVVPIKVRESDMTLMIEPDGFLDLIGKEEAAASKALLDHFLKLALPGMKSKGEMWSRTRPRFPGQIRPVWNVPDMRDNEIAKQERLMDRIKEILDRDGYAFLTEASKSLEGLDKSRIAVEYAYRYLPDYDVVWWLRAGDPATLAYDFASLGYELSIHIEDVLDQEALIEAVKAWLEGNSSWLLIFDNAYLLSDLQEFMPHTRKGHVIITSRNVHWEMDWPRQNGEQGLVDQ
jgi:hypothetical protein